MLIIVQLSVFKKFYIRLYFRGEINPYDVSICFPLQEIPMAQLFVVIMDPLFLGTLFFSIQNKIHQYQVRNA